MRANLSYLYFLLVLSTCLASDPDRVRFDAFRKQFNKSYNSEYEHEYRFSVFKRNLKIAEELQSEDKHALYGVTKFADLTQEEFRSNYLIKNFTSPKKQGMPYPKLTVPPFNRTAIPAAFDWRNEGVVTGVYNQGVCGSCWAFSTAENVESMWAIAGHGLVNLAMQQLVDCDSYSHGCSGGNPPNAYEYIEQAGGIDSLASYPYVGTNEACRFNPASVAAKVNGWGYITTVDNEDAMLSWVATRGPPSICVDAQVWQYYRGGVVTGNCGNSLDHCVQITGYQTIQGIPVWNVRNSWSTDWGYSGYIYIMKGANICGIGDEVTSSTVP